MTNFEKVFSYLEWLDEQRSGRDYLVGNHATVADVHAFTHLARIDSVYASLYRLNRRSVRDHANVAAYMKRLAELPGFSETLDFPTIREGYFLSWNQPSNGKFVPLGPDVDTATGLLAA